MPSIELNKFYEGIKGDDILGASWGIIDAENLDGTRTGYGITLGPKPTKQVLTSTSAIRGIYNRTDSGATTSLFMYGDNGVVYRGDSADNTPFYTLPSTNHIHNMLFSPSSKYYMVIQTATDTYSIGRINSDMASGITESVVTGVTTSEIPPMYADNTFMYVGLGTTIYTYSNSDAQASYPLFPTYISGITKHGTNFYVYSTNGALSLWNGSASALSAQLDLGIKIKRVEQQAGVDYITTYSGDIYQLSGYSAAHINEKAQSNRLSDNTQYITKFDFTTGDEDNRTIAVAKNNVFLIANDTQPGIYKLGNIQVAPGQRTGQGLHKVLTEDNTNTNVDYIYGIYYKERLNTLWYSYLQGATYGVDYIDLDQLTTAQDGYFVTQIFRGPPNKVNKYKELKVTTSYTSGDNYIKIYRRKNNSATWDLIKTINDTTDEITRHRITTVNGTPMNEEFIDTQFKVEIHNDLQTNTPPIFHGMEFIYTINKE